MNLRYSITSNLKIYQRIGKNFHQEELDFELIAILWESEIPQNFWHRKRPEYLHLLFDVLPKQTICEMKAL